MKDMEREVHPGEPIMKSYSYEEVEKSAIDYFNGDELAGQVWAKKYALKDAAGNIYERTPDDMHRRISREFARIENNYPNPLSEQEIYDVLKDFKYIVPQGSPMAGIGNDFQYVSISNCFVIGNDEDSDSYGGILKLDEELVQLMKRRGGVGLDLSFVRPANSPVMNSALTSTGVVPFMERFSNSTREVAQGGRRGALMETIHIAHPDSEAFIDAKMVEGKVTGANVSVKISDDFMKSVIAGDEFKLQFPVESPNPEYTKFTDAKKLWDKIVHNAWKSAEPGILFWDTLINDSIPDAYADLGFKTVSTNPCIVGDTLIATADGRNAVPIKQLVKEGKDVPVYSTNPNTGQREIKWARNPRLTKKKAEVWKLTLDDGSELIATPDHKILNKKLEYVELKDLKAGDSLTPFYSFNSNGYRQISSVGAKMKGGAYRNRRQYRVIHEFYSGTVVPGKEFAIHHVDFNNKNDAYENLRVMTHKEHIALHAEKMRGKNNPYHKMSDEWKHNFASRPGKTNPMYIDISNEELVKHGKTVFENEGILTKRNWMKYAKENNLPQFLGNEFRFNSFGNFKNQVANNHKVKSVAFHGYEDVYNITVDDNHNYDVITSTEDDNFITSSGITIKNCGEIPLCPNDSCRLMALNLYSYVIDPFKSTARFDFELFSKHVRIAQRLMDDLIDIELEKIDKILNKIKSDPESDSIKRTEYELWEKIKQKCIDGRRTGLGITAEGDMLAALGLRYGSIDANKFSENLHMKLKHSAYWSSHELGQERGTFRICDTSREKDHPWMLRIKSEDEELYNALIKDGRRNIALLTIAPTGSLSILTQTTSGIEPAFLIAYMRRRKINSNDIGARVDFTDEVGDTWQEYPVFHHKFKDWYIIESGNEDTPHIALEELESAKMEDIEKLIEKSPWYKATSADIDWEQKVKMQGMVQKHVDHSISVTVNLPNDITEEMVGKVYMTGWEAGCKGLTVYRDGSRSGVLVSSTEKEQEEKEQLFKDNNAPKRPKVIDASVVRFNNNLEKWIAVVGTLDGRPYELFTGKLEGLPDIPNYVKSGEIIKSKTESGSRYDFRYVDKSGHGVTIEGLSRSFDPEYWNYAKLISGILRHGMPLPSVIDLIKSLNLDDDSLNTWKAGVIRVIKKFIKDGTKIKNKCTECGEDSAVYTEGCLTCSNCGYSECS